jgi:small subunit ribosomal protein S6
MSNKHYELMVIYTPILSAEEFKAESNALANFITTQGGSMVAEDSWGLKSLAYPIQKKTTGLYFVTEFSTASSINQKVETFLNRNENVLRFMVTVLDKHAVAYNDRKRKGIKVEPKVRNTETVTTQNEN